MIDDLLKLHLGKSLYLNAELQFLDMSSHKRILIQTFQHMQFNELEVVYFKMFVEKIGFYSKFLEHRAFKNLNVGRFLENAGFNLGLFT